MNRFSCLLIGLAAASFYVGLQSADSRDEEQDSLVDRDAVVAREAGRELQSPFPGRERFGQLAERPRLDPEVLEKVRFDRFAGGKVTPVARKLFQLSREDCLQVNEALRLRGEELAVLREAQEGKAFRIEAMGDWRTDYQWEVPVDNEARRKIWLGFLERVAAVVGDEIGESLVSEFEHPEELPGHRRRHLVMAGPGDYLMRVEFMQIGDTNYNTHQTIIGKAEVCETLLTTIELELAQAGENPLKDLD